LLWKMANMKRVQFYHYIPEEDIQKIKKISEGSFGDVFSGKWNDKSVAIKEIEEQKSDKAVVAAEISVLSLLSHPNVISLYGISTNENAILIVTELMETDLREAMMDFPDVFSHKKKNMDSVGSGQGVVVPPQNERPTSRYQARKLLDIKYGR